MNIKKYLQDQVNTWEKLGHPALLERFVLRNGRPFQSAPFQEIRGTIKECFKNAMQHIWLNPSEHYVEGFGLRPNLFPIFHAWCVSFSNVVVDMTWDKPEECEYFGVIIPRHKAMKSVLDNKVYGILDTGNSLNTKIMFEMDPELKKIYERIRQKKQT